jgi:hypothetical protein
MNQELGKRHRNGVVCLFCKMGTPLPAGARACEDGIRVLIMRCRACGKEAPYQASDIIEFKEGASGATPTRAAGRVQIPQC